MFKKIKSIIKSKIKNVVLEEVKTDRNKIEQLIQTDINNGIILNSISTQLEDFTQTNIHVKELQDSISKIINDNADKHNNIDKLYKRIEEEFFTQRNLHIKEFQENIKKFEIIIQDNQAKVDINIEKLKFCNLADENDFKAFYKLLLNREPENGAIKVGEILRKDLFNSIIFSEEYKLLHNENSFKFVENLWDKPTYSQAGEDSILFYIFKMLNIQYQEITYLDLGANHAKDLSNTYFFYERGASGVLVEANPKLCESLKMERERDIIINKCISTDSGQILDFYILNGDGLSSADKTSIDKAIAITPQLKVEKVVKVESICVNNILNKYFPDKAPTILNIDIEGNEMEILNQIDFKKYRPMIVIIEMIPYDTKLVIGKKNEIIYKKLTGIGYREYAFTGINSIFIDNKIIEKHKS